MHGNTTRMAAICSTLLANWRPTSKSASPSPNNRSRNPSNPKSPSKDDPRPSCISDPKLRLHPPPLEDLSTKTLSPARNKLQTQPSINHTVLRHLRSKAPPRQDHYLKPQSLHRPNQRKALRQHHRHRFPPQLSSRRNLLLRHLLLPFHDHRLLLQKTGRDRNLQPPCLHLPLALRIPQSRRTMSPYTSLLLQPLSINILAPSLLPTLSCLISPSQPLRR